MKLCMFTPHDLELERGWPGIIEGDTVVQVAAQTLQAFFTGGGTARRHAEYPLAEVDFRAAGSAPALGAGLLRLRATRQDRARASRAGGAARVVRAPGVLLLQPRAIYGPEDEIPYPPDTKELDYELEVAAIVGADGQIGGFTIMNDWSARDLQRAEMRVGLGPAKGKDFATSLGPVLVTPDEFDGTSAAMVARVNGEERSRGNLSDLFHSWEAIVAHASRNTHLRAGRRPRLRHSRDGVHPRARRRPLAATRRRGRARGRGHRHPAEPRRLTRARAEIVVVGAGIMGSATAHALARQGRDVLLVEQFEVGHEHGSSHGRSRIVRLAYPELEFVELAKEAFAGWRGLEREAGVELLELNGLLELVRERGSELGPALAAAGASVRAARSREGARRWPVGVPDGWTVLFQPEAGIVRADAAHRAFVDRAVASGARLEENTRIQSLDEIDADAVVVTAGAWVREFFPDLPVRVTRETVAYFRRDGQPLPSVVQLDPATRGHAMYSLHDPVHGLKAGAHHAGAEVSPDEPARTGPGSRRADLRVGRPHLPRCRARARRRRDVPLHDHSGRALHPRAARAGRDRLAVQRPRLQVRAGDRATGSRHWPPISFSRAVLPASRRRPAQASHPVPRQRNAPDRGGHGDGGLRRERSRSSTTSSRRAA